MLGKQYKPLYPVLYRSNVSLYESMALCFTLVGRSNGAASAFCRLNYSILGSIRPCLNDNCSQSGQFKIVWEALQNMTAIPTYLT